MAEGEDAAPLLAGGQAAPLAAPLATQQVMVVHHHKHLNGPALFGFRMSHHAASGLVPFMGFLACVGWCLTLASVYWQHQMWRIVGFSCFVELGLIEFDFDAYQLFSWIHGLIFSGRVMGGVAGVFMKDIPNIAAISKMMMPAINEIEKLSGRNSLLFFGNNCENVFQKIANTGSAVADKHGGAKYAGPILYQIGDVLGQIEKFMDRKGCGYIRIANIWSAYITTAVVIVTLIFLHGCYDVYEQKPRMRVLLQMAPGTFANATYVLIANKITAWDKIENIFMLLMGVTGGRVHSEIRIPGIAMMVAGILCPCFIFIFVVTLYWYRPHPPHMHHMYYQQLANSRAVEAAKQQQILRQEQERLATEKGKAKGKGVPSEDLGEEAEAAGKPVGKGKGRGLRGGHVRQGKGKQGKA